MTYIQITQIVMQRFFFTRSWTNLMAMGAASLQYRPEATMYVQVFTFADSCFLLSVLHTRPARDCLSWHSGWLYVFLGVMLRLRRVQTKHEKNYRRKKTTKLFHIFINCSFVHSIQAKNIYLRTWTSYFL